MGPGVRFKLVFLSVAVLVVVSFGFTALSLSLTRGWIEDDLRERAIAFGNRQVSAAGLPVHGERHTLRAKVSQWRGASFAGITHAIIAVVGGEHNQHRRIRGRATKRLLKLLAGAGVAEG